MGQPKEDSQDVINMQTKIEYSIHEETNQICIKIIDKESNELIKEIPSEKILVMVAKISNWQGYL